MSFHFFLSATNSLHLLNPSTRRSLSTSSFHVYLDLPLLLVHSSSWVKIFLGILSSILSRWPNQLILCPFIHFTIFSPLLISSSSRLGRLFHSPFSYLESYKINHFTLLKLHGPADEVTTALRNAGNCPPSDTQPHMPEHLSFFKYSLSLQTKYKTIIKPTLLKHWTLLRRQYVQTLITV